MSSVGSWREPITLHKGQYARLCQQLHIAGVCVCYVIWCTGREKDLFHLYPEAASTPFYASEFTGAQEDHVLLICTHTEENCDETTILQGGQSQHLAATYGK